MTTRARPEKQQQARGRRRARITVRILTGVCALVVLTIGATELTSNGFQAFVDRPPGVGATPSDDGKQQAASSGSAKQKTAAQGAQQGAANAPNPVAPSPLPPFEPAPIVPGPRGGDRRPGFPHPGGGRHRPGPRRGPPNV